MKKIMFLLLFNCGFIIAQTKTVVTPYGEKVTINPYVNNGLTPNNGYIQLGGPLTQPSVLTTSATNTLSLLGLPAGTVNDNIIVTDPAGVLKTLTVADVNAFNWRLLGNAGTNSAINFIGTTDNVPLQFKINNTNSGKISQTATAFGYNALNPASTGISNTAIGISALSANTTGKQNTAIGESAMKSNTTGYGNTVVGYSSLLNHKNGFSNIAIGTQTLQNLTNGNANTAIGNTTAQNVTMAYGNIYIGTNAGNLMTEGDYNTLIGPMTNASSPTADHELNIGNAIFATNVNPTGSNNTIMSTTKVGIGIQNPTTVLHVYSNPASGLDPVRFEGLQFPDFYNVDDYEIKDSEHVVIADATGVLKIVSPGSILLAGTPSDERLKKDIETSSYGLDFINKLRPVTYHMKKGTAGLQTGFIAQEVESAAHELHYDFNGIVKPKTDDSFYRLRYDQFVAPLVKAVQEQQNQIDKIKNLEEKLEDQKRQIKELTDLITQLTQK